VENVKARFAAVTTFSFAHNEPMYIAATSQIVLAQNIGYLNELTAGAPPHSEGERRGGDEERRGGRERKKEGDKAKGGNPRNGREGENGKRKEIKQREEIRGMAFLGQFFLNCRTLFE